MKFYILLFLALAGTAHAQSGRQKPSPTPTPKGNFPRTIMRLPGEITSFPRGATPTPTPDNDEIIKVDSVLVPIPVSVLDTAGRAVSSLKLADFELKINGQIAAVDELSTRADTAIRLAMLFDNSSSVFVAREFEKDAAVRFFRRVIRPERDLAALFSVSDYTRLEQPFTRDVDALTRSIELFEEPKGATALLDAIIEGARYLRSASGRRVMVIVSDGEDTYSDLATTLEAVVRELLINDCQVYVVNTKEFENFKRTGVRGGNANIRTLTAERRMQEITQQTGGAVYSPIDESELKAAFDRIAADLSQQYVLSYYPDEPTAKPGELRQISVAVKGRPNLSIRTRKGYYVPKR